MGVYALFLTGSNFVAPLIAGFINDGQGWKWVLVSHWRNDSDYNPAVTGFQKADEFLVFQYWCAIFNGIGFVFCFIFMEETNYHRTPQLAIEPVVEASSGSSDVSPSKEVDPEKQPAASASPAPSTRAGAMSSGGGSRKTFWQKMTLFRREDLQQENKLKGMVLRPLIFLTFPVIFAAGFMYGSILCYFNVLNGTTSLILSAAPYNFSSSMVGLTYVACILGISVG